MHGHGQLVVAVIVGSRRVFQQIQCGINVGPRTLDMDGRRAVRCRVDKGQARDTAEIQCAMGHRHIRLHNVTGDIRVGNRKGADSGKGAVFRHCERSRRSKHRGIVDARDGEL